MPPASIEWIVHGLRVNAEVSSWPPAGADHDDLAVTAIVLGLAPLLHWRLAGAGQTLQPRAQAKLAASRQAAAQREAAIFAQLAEVLGALAERSLTPVVLKGAYLATAVYPAAGLRPMNDIDLLFRAADLPAAGQVLQSLGYQERATAAESGARVAKHTSTYRRAGQDAPTPNPYLSPAGGRTVEPHGTLEESWYGLRVDITPGVWERARAVTAAGCPAQALSVEDNLLHVAVHLVFHLIMGYPSLVQLMDVRFALEHWQDELDWPRLQAQAGVAAAGPFLYGALRLAHKSLDAPVPAAVLQDLAANCPPGLRAQAERLSLADVLRRTQRPPVVTLRQRLAHGLAERMEVARWAPSLAAKWQVWRTALDVGRTDTGRLLARRVGLRA